MEQRWQDLANLLSFPPAMGMPGDMSSHYSPHHYPYQVRLNFNLILILISFKINCILIYEIGKWTNVTT
jgi:hypothetical protein